MKYVGNIAEFFGRRSTKVGLVALAALSVFVGGKLDLDKKVLSMFSNGAHYAYSAAIDSVTPDECKEYLGDIYGLPPEAKARLVATQTDDEVGNFITAFYETTDEATQKKFLETGFNQLPYDGKIETLDYMLGIVEYERTQGVAR